MSNINLPRHSVKGCKVNNIPTDIINIIDKYYKAKTWILASNDYIPDNIKVLEIFNNSNDVIQFILDFIKNKYGDGKDGFEFYAWESEEKFLISRIGDTFHKLDVGLNVITNCYHIFCNSYPEFDFYPQFT